MQKCPYCATQLDKMPKRKKKCPHCGNYIFVKRGKLFTEDQRLIEDWLDRLSHFNVTKQTFDRHQRELAEQFGQPPSINDTVWRILNSLVDEVCANFLYTEMVALYTEMARLVISEGRNPKPYLAEAAKYELLELQRSGIIKRVNVNTVNDNHVCSGCRAMSKKTFTIEQALNDMPIPNACENENGCRCWYSAVVEGIE